MSDLVEQVARAIHDVLENDDDSKGGGYMRAARAALSVLEPRIEALEAENFKLAAGACTVEGGLIGDDHGHFDCSLKARIEALERELAEARDALVAEREETLWSAYSSGLEKDGRWTHMFMSDGLRYLVRPAPPSAPESAGDGTLARVNARFSDAGDSANV